MGSINTFGVPTTLKSVKKLIDKKEEWKAEISQIKVGIIQIQGTSNWTNGEIRGLPFKPDVVFAIAGVNQRSATDDDIIFGYSAYKISSDFIKYLEMNYNGNKTTQGTIYKYNGTDTSRASVGSSEIEYDDGFTDSGLRWNGKPDTSTSLMWIAIKYVRE